MTASGDYGPFPDLAAQAVRGAAREAGLRLGAPAPTGSWRACASSVFDDVKRGLEELQGTRIPLAVLSNGTADVMQALVAHNDLDGVFEHVLVADSVKRFKPAREVARARHRCVQGPAPDGSCWSAGTSGTWPARRAPGLRNRLDCARGEKYAPALGAQADIEAEDLRELAARITR